MKKNEHLVTKFEHLNIFLISISRILGFRY